MKKLNRKEKIKELLELKKCPFKSDTYKKCRNYKTCKECMISNLEGDVFESEKIETSSFKILISKIKKSPFIYFLYIVDLVLILVLFSNILK